MALDAVSVALVANELHSGLIGSRIDKIFMPSKEEVLFILRSLRDTGKNEKLLISVRSGGARIGIVDEDFENPDTPPSFCMLLRKYLSGAKIDNICAVPGERIINILFFAKNEIGDGRQLMLAVELMGRYANLVIYDSEGKIIDALKRIDFEDSKIRQLLPGIKYSLPQKADREYFLDAEPRALARAILNSREGVVKGFLQCTTGAGPVVAREIACRSGLTSIEDESGSDSEIKLAVSIKELQREASADNPPIMVKDSEGKPCEFCFFTPVQFPTDYLLLPYKNFSLLLSDYYGELGRSIRLQQKSGNLQKQVRMLLEKAQRKHSVRSEELEKSEQYEQSRLYGELLSAYAHNIKQGDISAQVINYYTGETVIISLDKRLTPMQNSQYYFNDYKKKQTAKRMLSQLLVQGQREISYLKSIGYETSIAKTETQLLEVRRELKEAGYLKYYKVREKKQKPADFRRFVSTDSFPILVGRNNAQNEKLSVKIAGGKDMWFHIKNAPGSHVVVISQGKEIPLTTQNQAAMLAAYYSSGRGAGKVAIDYTLVKNLKKTADLPLGMVIYDNYETAFVCADQKDILGITKA